MSIGIARYDSLLLTDLYQLTMLQAYLEAGLGETAVFELFVRKLPPRRGFLMASGLGHALDFLETAGLSPEELDWLRTERPVSPAATDFLAGFRFSGDVDALPEGTVFFPNEPVLRVVAPLPEAQILETQLINIVHFQTLIASKAARSVLAAPGKLLVDFGLRRAHGREAGLWAAEAAYLAGFAGTATVLAKPDFGIPIYGTMAHSYIEAHETEAEAFVSFARANPDNVTLLIDTYDTLEGARTVVRVAPRLAVEGITVRAVRLDSGDLPALARKVRRILDEGGLADVGIFASGGLDESQLASAAFRAAPIDGYGIGTSLTTSSDAPALDCAYKLQEYAGTGRRKYSTGKRTWPGRKQVFRRFGADGRMRSDLLTVEGDAAEGTPLLVPVMRGGKRLAPPESLDARRDRARRQLGALPDGLRRLDADAVYEVEVSQALRDLAEEVDRTLAAHVASASSA